MTFTLGRGSARTLEQRIDLRYERRQVALDDTPRQPIVDLCVGVHEDVAERDDPTVIRDALAKRTIELGEAIERFADDLDWRSTAARSSWMTGT